VTYCVGTLVDQGLVFLSDSRTNAGVDNVSTFRKMTIYEHAGERVLVLLTAGNLAITQAVVSLLNDMRPDDGVATLRSATGMTEAARVVGDTIRLVYDRDAAALKEHGIEFSANFILGGQIGSEAPRLFQLYAAGNYIEATRETPYFQIGESKYGKPVIDRVLQPETSLNDVAKCLLISMDSTLRSNLSVGLPLDLAICPRDALKVSHRLTLGEDDPYFRTVRSSWSAALEQAFHDVPDPDWD
jgi:putative proteasome-type protease